MSFLIPAIRDEILRSGIVSRIYHYGNIDSTMSEARRIIEEQIEIAPKTLIIAESQTEGYGRFKREWHSPESGLYFTIVINKKLDQSFALVVGLAIAEAIEDVLHFNVELSWPNDILYKSKKIAGVICERTGDFTLVGIGVNTFPCELLDHELEGFARSIPVSRPQRSTILASIITKLAIFLERFERDGFAPFRDAYQHKLSMFGRRITVKNGDSNYSGILKGIDGKGAIILDDEKQKRVFSSAEITSHEFKIKKGS